MFYLVLYFFIRTFHADVAAATWRHKGSIIISIRVVCDGIGSGAGRFE